MKQLGVLDNAFLTLERRDTPYHIGGLGIYDPATAPGGQVRFKQILATFQRRLEQQALFHTRLATVPGGLDRPYWVRDAGLNLEFHLRHIALPQPGDWRQLCIQVARLHARKLDLSQPLWEAYVIEGLDGIPGLPPGCFAIYTKIHHALVDGVAGTDIMALIHDLAPTVTGDRPTPAGSPLEEPPAPWQMLARAPLNNVRNTYRLGRDIIATGWRLGGYLSNMVLGRVSTPELLAPHSLFNDPVGPHRVFDAAELPLDGFKKIKNATHTKVNDVALAVIAGAMRRYLEAKSALPEGALVAGIPMDMRGRRRISDDNNQVGMTAASLHTDITSPLERLLAIHASTSEAKALGETGPFVDVLRLPGTVPPVLARPVAGLWARHHLSRHLPTTISTIVSNVAGPDFPLYCSGARLVDYFGLGLLTPGIATFHLVFSYAGTVTLSVLADRDIMPDPEFYHDCLVAAYEELYAAVPGLGGSGKVPPRARARTNRRKRAPARAGHPRQPAKPKARARARRRQPDSS